MRERPCEHPPGQPTHQTGLLGEGQVGVRLDQSAVGVAPADERLDGHNRRCVDRAGADSAGAVHHGRSRHSIRRRGGACCRDRRVRGRRGQTECLELGAVHGHVSAIHRRVAVGGGRGGERDADARPDRCTDRVDSKRLVELGAELDGRRVASSAPAPTRMAANSSPPTRTSRSVERSNCSSRALTRLRISSPAGWPKESSIRLRPLRSMNRNARRPVVRWLSEISVERLE